jgi:hypothetical protein
LSSLVKLDEAPLNPWTRNIPEIVFAAVIEEDESTNADRDVESKPLVKKGCFIAKNRNNAEVLFELHSGVLTF